MLGTSGNDVTISSTVNIDLVSDLRRADWQVYNINQHKQKKHAIRAKQRASATYTQGMQGESPACICMVYIMSPGRKAHELHDLAHVSWVGFY